MALRVSGLRGQLRVGYQVAAELGPWRLALAPQLPRTYTVDAIVDQISAYWIAERPLVLALEVGRDMWVWAHVDPSIGGDTVTAVVCGAPTVVRGAASRIEERA